MINEPSFLHFGAMHKAGWMANNIYTIKILLLSQEIEQLLANTILNKHQKAKLEQYGCFIVHNTYLCKLVVYLSRDKLWNNLQLYQNLLRYKEVDSLVANSGIERHKWYTSELILVSLFSEEVSVQERSEMAKMLLEKKPQIFTVAERLIL